MSDASKRRLDAGEVDHASEISSWEAVTPIREGALRLSAPSDPKLCRLLCEYYEVPISELVPTFSENIDIPLPPDEKSVFEWGRTVCAMPKYRSEKFTYLQLMLKAKTDVDCENYLKWIVGKFGFRDEPPAPVLTNPSPGQDLARFLQRIKWTPPGDTDRKFIRQKA